MFKLLSRFPKVVSSNVARCHSWSKRGPLATLINGTMEEGNPVKPQSTGTTLEIQNNSSVNSQLICSQSIETKTKGLSSWWSNGATKGSSVKLQLMEAPSKNLFCDAHASGSAGCIEEKRCSESEAISSKAKQQEPVTSKRAPSWWPSSVKGNTVKLQLMEAPSKNLFCDARASGSAGCIEEKTCTNPEKLCSKATLLIPNSTKRTPSCWPSGVRKGSPARPKLMDAAAELFNHDTRPSDSSNKIDQECTDKGTSSSWQHKLRWKTPEQQLKQSAPSRQSHSYRHVNAVADLERQANLKPRKAEPSALAKLLRQGAAICWPARRRSY